MTGKKSAAAHIWLIIILGAVAYLNSLGGEFIWDDHAFVEQNAYIKDWSRIKDIFAGNVGEGAGKDSDVYRPLQIFTYLIDHSLWGLNPVGYHFTNVLLHLAHAALVYWLILVLFGSSLLSLLTAALFVAHPAHTEAVSYISGRGDLLSGLFMLLCLVAYVKDRDSGRFWQRFLMYLSYALAILSKENALALPLLLLLYHFSFRKKIKLAVFLPFIGTTVVYLLLRSGELTSLYPGTGALFRRLPGFFVAIASYIRILFLPVSLHMEHGNGIFRPTDPMAVCGLLLFILLVIYALKGRESRPLLSFSILWFFIALSPTNSVFPPAAFFMAEHWLYFPSIGFFLILAKAAVFLYNRNRKARLAAAAIMACGIFLLASSTARQNNYWGREIPFYETTLKYAPDSAQVHNNLASVYAAGSRKGKAIEHYRRAISINPKTASAYYGLAIAYSEAGEKEEAALYYNKAIESQPDYKEAYLGLCQMYAEDKDPQAQASCKKAVEIAPRNSGAYYNLGDAYYNAGDRQASMEAMRKAIEIDPGNVAAYNNLASVYTEVGRVSEALALWEKAAKISPDFAIAHFNLAVFYFKEKNYALAIKHCDRVLELGHKVDPEFLKLLEPYRIEPKDK